MKKKNVIRVLLFALFSLCSLQSFIPTGEFAALTGVAATVDAEEGWRAEFEAVCKKTQEPTALTVTELRDFIARCDALKIKLEKLDDHIRKVPLLRLEKARKLFVFTLEYKENLSR